MKGFIHARAGGAGGGSKPVPPPIRDLPPPPSPFETGTRVPEPVGGSAPPPGTFAYYANKSLLVLFGLLFLFAFVQMVRQIIRQRRESGRK